MSERQNVNGSLYFTLAIVEHQCNVKLSPILAQLANTVIQVTLLQNAKQT